MVRNGPPFRTKRGKGGATLVGSTAGTKGLSTAQAGFLPACFAQDDSFLEYSFLFVKLHHNLIEGIPCGKFLAFYFS